MSVLDELANCSSCLDLCFRLDEGVCEPCRQARDDPDVFGDDSRIRCPACGNVDGTDDLLEGLKGGNVVGVTCSECDHDYEIQVEFSVIYSSPTRNPEAS